MIKARMKGATGDMILLGLSYGNLDKLRADGMKGCIKINGAELGITQDIFITAAPTEADMAAIVAEFIGPETKLHIDKKLKQ